MPRERASAHATTHQRRRLSPKEKARRTMERLMADDMFNGWGVRTLSEKERRYNPVGYHQGRRKIGCNRA